MNRFILQKSEKPEYDFVCTDKINQIVCEFKQGQFNDSQKFTVLNDITMDALTLAKTAREMSQWLIQHHIILLH